MSNSPLCHPTLHDSNALGCGLGVLLLLNSGVTASLSSGISAMSAHKVSIPLKQVCARDALHRVTQV